MDKDGKITEAAAQGYAYFADLATRGGMAYAMEYIKDPDTKRFLENAWFLDQGHANSEAALKQAADVEARKEQMAKDPKVSPPSPQDVRGFVTKMLDRADFKLTDFLPYNWGTPNLSRWATAPTESEMKAIRNNPVLPEAITERAMKYMKLGYLEEAAVRAAGRDELARSVNIFGSLVRSSSNTTLYEDAGVSQYADTPNFFHEASVQLISEMGPKYWGSKFEPIMGSTDKLQGFRRGIPIDRVQATYNSMTKEMVYTLYEEKEDNFTGEKYLNPVGNPLRLPIRMVGEQGKLEVLRRKGLEESNPAMQRSKEKFRKGLAFGSTIY
jgi:hypothetical protein